MREAERDIQRGDGARCKPPLPPPNEKINAIRPWNRKTKIAGTCHYTTRNGARRKTAEEHNGARRRGGG